MAHYAKVIDGIVYEVIVAEAEFFNSYTDDKAGEWLKTSYNTHGGVHSEGGTPLRKNFASVGFIYNSEADAFYSPQPYPSWTLNTSSYLWEAPVSYPEDDNHYEWDEENRRWNIV
tara:strand:- start:115 stop:459 length:345 start_codon:yes stop_codon:yes gene_type:complete